MATVDFHKKLIEQLDFLESSCRLYDDGKLHEAIRIAQALRVLFHTTNVSTSILTHLNAESIQLLSSAKAAPGQHEWCSLVETSWIAGLGNPFLAKPKLDGALPGQFIPFVEWRGKERVWFTRGSTRRDFVLWAANKDGGSHVDDKIPLNYEEAKSGSGFGIKVTAIIDDEGRSTPIPPEQQEVKQLENMHLACLRQIGFEVLHSPDLLKLRNPPS